MHGSLHHMLRLRQEWVLKPVLDLQFSSTVYSVWPRACGVSVMNACSASLDYILL